MGPVLWHCPIGLPEPLGSFGPAPRHDENGDPEHHRRLNLGLGGGILADRVFKSKRTPVYMSAFCDRLFYASDGWANKPCACVVSARRAGTTAALDQLVKYPMISNMPVVSSQYWPMVHGACPEDVAQDAEGLQTMRQLARNLLWLLQCMAAGDAAGVARPETEARTFTNFIR